MFADQTRECFIYDYKDYAVGIVDARGDLICQCTAGMPVFVANVMRAAVQDGLKLRLRLGQRYQLGNAVGRKSPIDCEPKSGCSFHHLIQSEHVI